MFIKECPWDKCSCKDREKNKSGQKWIQVQGEILRAPQGALQGNGLLSCPELVKMARLYTSTAISHWMWDHIRDMSKAAPSHSGHHTLFSLCFFISRSCSFRFPPPKRSFPGPALFRTASNMPPLWHHLDSFVSGFSFHSTENNSLTSPKVWVPSQLPNPLLTLTAKGGDHPCISQLPTSSACCNSQFFCLQVLSKVNRQAVTPPFSFLFEESKLVNWTNLNLLKLMKRSPLLETSQYFNTIVDYLWQTSKLI